MRFFTKHILMLTLAILSAVSLQGQNKGVWSVYADAGVSGFVRYRNVPGNLTRHDISPDVNAGFSCQIGPWVRVGVNLGYTKLSTVNTTNGQVINSIDNYEVGNYDDGVLVQVITDLHRFDEAHCLFAGGTVEFNFMEIFKSKVADKFGVWLGTGVGYAGGWNHSTLTQAYSETAVAQGAGHANIMIHDYITSEGEDTHADSMYVPLALSLEYFVSKHISLTLGGYYRCLPLDIRTTPTGLWGTDFGIRCTFK